MLQLLVSPHLPTPEVLPVPMAPATVSAARAEIRRRIVYHVVCPPAPEGPVAFRIDLRPEGAKPECILAGQPGIRPDAAALLRRLFAEGDPAPGFHLREGVGISILTDPDAPKAAPIDAVRKEVYLRGYSPIGFGETSKR